MNIIPIWGKQHKDEIKDWMIYPDLFFEEYYKRKWEGDPRQVFEEMNDECEQVIGRPFSVSYDSFRKRRDKQMKNRKNPKKMERRSRSEPDPGSNFNKNFYYMDNHEFSGFLESLTGWARVQIENVTAREKKDVITIKDAIRIIHLIATGKEPPHELQRDMDIIFNEYKRLKEFGELEIGSDYYRIVFTDDRHSVYGTFNKIARDPAVILGRIFFLQLIASLRQLPDNEPGMIDEPWNDYESREE